MTTPSQPDTPGAAHPDAPHHVRPWHYPPAPPGRPVPYRHPPRMPRPQRPTYRESRPVRWWTALVSLAAGFLFYVLLGLLAWNLTSFSFILVLGMLVAGALAMVLLARGDRGGAVGLAIATGFALAVVVTAVGWSVYLVGDGVFG